MRLNRLPYISVPSVPVRKPALSLATAQPIPHRRLSAYPAALAIALPSLLGILYAMRSRSET
ncbi:MAG TPA: hypothetical protein VFU32_01015, partial [Ktedonobacterales bacterium]|nr:hypothetical protein [Ktedonobacterales bacterium]